MEDSFSTDVGGWGGLVVVMVQAVMRAMGSNGVRWGATDETSLAHPPAAHLLLGGPVPNLAAWRLGTPAVGDILLLHLLSTID